MYPERPCKCHPRHHAGLGECAGTTAVGAAAGVARSDVTLEEQQWGKDTTKHAFARAEMAG